MVSDCTLTAWENIVIELINFSPAFKHILLPSPGYSYKVYAYSSIMLTLKIAIKYVKTSVKYDFR